MLVAGCRGAGKKSGFGMCRAFERKGLRINGYSRTWWNQTRFMVKYLQILNPKEDHLPYCFVVAFFL